MPPKKNKVSSSPCKPGPDVVHKPDPTKQAFKRNMEELGPVLEATMEDLDEYYNIVREMKLEMDSPKFKNTTDPAKFKNEMKLLTSVIAKMEEALNGLQEAAKFTNEIVLQESVGSKMEQALDALQEAAALTHFVDGGNEAGGRKKKKTQD